MSTGLNTPAGEAPRGYHQQPQQQHAYQYGQQDGYGGEAQRQQYAQPQYAQSSQQAQAQGQGQSQPSTGPVVGPARQRVAHGQAGESIEMTSAPVARRQ